MLAWVGRGKSWHCIAWSRRVLYWKEDWSICRVPSPFFGWSAWPRERVRLERRYVMHHWSVLGWREREEWPIRRFIAKCKLLLTTLSQSAFSCFCGINRAFEGCWLTQNRGRCLTLICCSRICLACWAIERNDHWGTNDERKKMIVEVSTYTQTVGVSDLLAVLVLEVAFGVHPNMTNLKQHRN